MNRKILTVVGARPQFIKAAPVSTALQDTGIEETLLHTGQHYDHGLSDVFFEEMQIFPPHLNLGIGSGPHGWQTGQMIAGIEAQIMKDRPGWGLGYGDTNSTLAGALAASKQNVALAHIEAGLRSYNRDMPEEINRVLTDHCADLLFCPTLTAVENLKQENIFRGVHHVGDVMYDAALQFVKKANPIQVMEKHGLKRGEYLLVTLHRPYNTDDADRLRRLIATLSQVDARVFFPLHPRTKQRIADFNIKLPDPNESRLIFSEPVGYLDMLVIESNARMIITDSGGVQKEAYFFGIPCITIRPETEWVETLEDGWNRLVWPDPEELLQLVGKDYELPPPLPHYGDGHAAEKIGRILQAALV